MKALLIGIALAGLMMASPALAQSPSERVDPDQPIPPASADELLEPTIPHGSASEGASSGNSGDDVTDEDDSEDVGKRDPDEMIIPPVQN